MQSVSREMKRLVRKIRRASWRDLIGSEAWELRSWWQRVTRTSDYRDLTPRQLVWACYHEEDYYWRMRKAKQAFKDGDVDLLRAYANSDLFEDYFQRRDMEVVFGHLRSVGHAEVFPLLHSQFFENGMKLAEVLRNEYHFDTANLYYKRTAGSWSEDCQPFCDALYRVVLSAPEHVVEYVLEDPQRSIRIAEERGITDHDALIEILEEVVSVDAATLLGGVL